MKKFIPIIMMFIFVVPSVASARVSPLTMKQAKIYAAGRAEFFHPDGGVDTVKSTWCNQWSNYQIDCGAEADGQVYDAELDWMEPTSCSATVDVFKNRWTGRITTRVEHNMFCIGKL